MTDPHPLPPTEALVRQAGFLRALAQALLHDEHASEDVVQATWLAALERPMDDVRNTRAWLARVATNVAIKLARSQARRDARERAAARPEALPSAGDVVEHEAMLRSVTDAVLGLAEPYRSTILMRYFEGLEAREIAERLDAPLATVRSRITRGHEALRTRLDEEYHGDRAAWSLGLAGLVGGERAGLVGAGIGTDTSTTVAGGALVMTSKLKLATLAFAILLGFSALWSGVFRAGETPSSRAADAARLVALPREEPREPEPAELDTGSSRSTIADAVMEATGVEPSHGSLRVFVTWFDGTPAAGVDVKVMPWGADTPFLESVRLRTDPRGEAHLSRVIAGKVSLYVARGGGTSLDVEPGGEGRAEIRIDEGLTARGRVVDLQGTPIPGAEIWLSDPGNMTEGVPVSTSGADGRFELRSVSDQNFIGARKAGHAPSPTFFVQGGVGDVFERDLVLQGAGARLRVHVADPRGLPVPDARVRIDAQGWGREGYATDTAMNTPIPYRLLTDANGTCEALSLTPGTVEVLVSRAGLAPYATSVELAALTLRELEVTLTAGVVVRGLAHTPDGDPLGGVEVRVGRYGEIDAREARTAADGTFRIAGVGTGAIAIRARLQGVGSAAGTLEGDEGEVLEWNPVIDSGRVLRGRLVDESGSALPGWSVAARQGSPGIYGGPQFRASARTDRDGRFAIVNCPEGELQVFVEQPGRELVFWDGRFDGLRAGEEEHVLVFDDAWRPTETIEGRLVGVDGLPASARVVLRHPDRTGSASEHTDHETGAFSFGPLAPGTYALEASQDDGARLGPLEVVVERDHSVDLGRLRLGGPGRLALTVAEVEGIDAGEVYAQIATLDTRVSAADAVRASETPVELELPAGRYELRFFGNVVSDEHTFTIEADRTTSLALTPRRGVATSYLFHLPADRVGPLELAARFYGPDGSLTWEQDVYLHSEPRYAHVIVPPAPYYRVEFEGPDGLSGSAVLDAATLSASPRRGAPVEVTLQ